MNRRYLILVLMAFVPSLSGCLVQSLHAKGEVDVNQPANPNDKPVVEELDTME